MNDVDLTNVRQVVSEVMDDALRKLRAEQPKTWPPIRVRNAVAAEVIGLSVHEMLDQIRKGLLPLKRTGTKKRKDYITASSLNDYCKMINGEPYFKQ